MKHHIQVYMKEDLNRRVVNYATAYKRSTSDFVKILLLKIIRKNDLENIYLK